jgi:HAE1 family hydrophobic/amphiphilic exporter-1
LGGASTDSVTVPLISGSPLTNANAFLLQTINTLHPGANIVPPTVTIPGTSPVLVGGFGRSLANVFRSDSPNYSVGLTISFPFRNRTAKADLAGARVLENQIATQTRAQEQVVIVEVRNAVQAVETARQRVLASRRARENAEELLKGERALFDNGRSTTFLLFQRENALTNARNLEIRAETDYNKAIADLQRATSTTFQMNNIDIVSPTDNK